MKGLIAIVTALITAVGAHAANGELDANSQAIPIFDMDGTTKLSGNAFLAALYWAPLGSSTFTAFTTKTGDSVPPFPFLSGAGAGYWDSRPYVVLYALNQAGMDVTVVARVWTTTAGSYENAMATGAMHQQSFPLQVLLGGVGLMPPADISGLKFPAIPEPSIVTLGVLGAGVLLFCRCRRLRQST